MSRRLYCSRIADSPCRFAYPWLFSAVGRLTRANPRRARVPNQSTLQDSSQFAEVEAASLSPTHSLAAVPPEMQ